MDQQETPKRTKRYIVPSGATFRHALRGIGVLLRTQANARFHCLASLLVLGMGCFFEITAHEWIAIALAIGLVWACETINTSIEMLADVVVPTFHPGIRNVKDVAAGAVLLASLTALATGCLVFWPYIFRP